MTTPILTPYQRKVLERVAEGMTSTPRYTPSIAELGDMMGLSQHTVKNHLRNIYDRLQDAGLIDTVHPDMGVAVLAAAAAGEIWVPRLAALGLIHAPGLTRVPSRRRRTTEQAESLELV